MNSIALKKFNSNVSVNGMGELTVNAGRYSRAAVIMAFELNGGIEKFAEWADENPSEFYTKMFSKLIGRENEAVKEESIEARLKALDGDSQDITDAEILPDEDVEGMKEVFEPSERDLLMARAADAYATSEPID